MREGYKKLLCGSDLKKNFFLLLMFLVLFLSQCQRLLLREWEDYFIF